VIPLLATLAFAASVFHPAQLSYVRTAILEIATMALFAASPMIFGKSAVPLVLQHPTGAL